MGYTRIDVCKNQWGKTQTVWFKHEFPTVGTEHVATLRPAPEVQSRTPEGKPCILEAFARVLAKAGQFDQPVPLKTLIDRVSELTAEDKEKLTAKHGQSRKRWLDDAFGGKDVSETMTDHGKLMRSSVRGAGTTLTLHNA